MDFLYSFHRARNDILSKPSCDERPFFLKITADVAANVVITYGMVKEITNEFKEYMRQHKSISRPKPPTCYTDEIIMQTYEDDMWLIESLPVFTDHLKQHWQREIADPTNYRWMYRYCGGSEEWHVEREQGNGDAFSMLSRPLMDWEDLEKAWLSGAFECIEEYLPDEWCLDGEICTVVEERMG